MPLGTLYQLQGLMPAQSPQSAVALPMILPCGGPVGVGGAFLQGQAMGLTGVPAQAHIFTATITTGGATGGNGYWVYYGDTVYSGAGVVGGITANATSAFPTAAQMQTALTNAVPPWLGNLTVTGSTGGPYTITFNQLCATKLIGGLLTFQFAGSTGGTPTLAVTTAQQGSAGSTQVNIYSQATNNRVDGFLQYGQSVDPVGCPGQLDLAGDIGQASGGTAFWVDGYYFADTTNYPEKSVVGLDANAFTLGKLTFIAGTSLSSPGCMIHIG